MTALSLHTGVPVVAAMGRGGGGRPRPVPEQANCPLGCWQVAGTGTSSGVSASKRGHLAAAFVRGCWGTFLVLQGEEDGGCHRLLSPPDRERGHTRPSALWGPCHGRGSQNPRAQPGARGTQKVPLRGGLSQIFHCDWHLSVAFTWRRSPPSSVSCPRRGSSPPRVARWGPTQTEAGAGVADAARKRQE